MKLINISTIILFIGFATGFGSCRRYLDAKSDQKLSTPETVDDLQAILDYPQLNNSGLNVADEMSDEYYLQDADWQSAQLRTNNAYVWDANLDDPNDWTNQYLNAYYSNTALYNLPLIKDIYGQGERMKQIKGNALFRRAYAFYNVAQLFAPQYNKNTASTDLGIPLRLDANFNTPSKRATLQETYDQILNDLTEASTLLTDVSSVKTRPSKVACYALLARIYLIMGDYLNAKVNANAGLQLYNTLMDFNDVNWIPDPFSYSPIKEFNPEIIFWSNTENPVNLDSRAKVDSNLYASFEANDMRKDVFFADNGDGTFQFKGSYNDINSIGLFQGIATDEVFLIRAEGYAREGNTAAAMQDLNTLLQKRWKSGTFIPLSANSSDLALKLILQERKKELIYRALRWTDLRRLSKDVSLAVTPRRKINGQVYDLPPNDPKYTLLIPKDIMNITNLQQNPRK